MTEWPALLEVNANAVANRKFKRPFSLSASISPARHTVNCTVFDENFPRSRGFFVPSRSWGRTCAML